MRRLIEFHKENHVPPTIATQIQRVNQRSILNTTTRRPLPNILRRNTAPIKHLNGASSSGTTASTSRPIPLEEQTVDIQKKSPMVDVSSMLSDFYKTNLAKAPKTFVQQLQLKQRQVSPTSAEKNSLSVAAIATNGAAKQPAMASKNLQRGEMSIPQKTQENGHNINPNNAMTFHPRLKFLNKHMQSVAAASATAADAGEDNKQYPETSGVSNFMTSIPSSVLVPPQSPQKDVKPIIDPTTGMVIEPNTIIKPNATTIAAVILQQQIRAAGLGSNLNFEENARSKIFEKILRQNGTQSQTTAGGDMNDEYNDNDDDEFDERSNNFDDIHLAEDVRNATANNYSLATSMPNIYRNSMENGVAHNSASDLSEAQKMIIAHAQAQAHAMRSLECTLSDFMNGGESQGAGSQGRLSSPLNGSEISNESIYECRHCGKRYRWKSTLRRHENVECGNKEPTHQCPYCVYKSKQRGNLGVHVRKHHSDMPQLESRRRSKYSQNVEANCTVRANSGSLSTNASDDSANKLVMDLPCSNK